MTEWIDGKVTEPKVTDLVDEVGRPIIEFADWLLVRDTIADMIKAPAPVPREWANMIAENLLTAGYIDVDKVIRKYRNARS